MKRSISGVTLALIAVVLVTSASAVSGGIPQAVAPLGLDHGSNAVAEDAGLAERVDAVLDRSTYVDPANDAGQAIDIERIEVWNSEGDFVNFFVATDNELIRADDRLFIVIDADRNPNTGDLSRFGSEYWIDMNGDGLGPNTPSAAVARFNTQTQQWVASASTTLAWDWDTSADSGGIFVIHNSELGGTTGFNFWTNARFPDAAPTSQEWAPDASTWSFLFDRTRPLIDALTAHCNDPCARGTVIELPWRFTRAEQVTGERYQVFRSGKQAAIYTAHDDPFFKAANVIRWIHFWPVPRRPVGWHQFCVRSFDEAGNTSPRDCARIVFPRINGQLTATLISRNGRVAIASLRVTELEPDTRVQVRRCASSCRVVETRTVNGTFTSRSSAVRAPFPPGVSLEIRATKDRWTGWFQRITAKAPPTFMKRSPEQCMAPGTTKPAGRCS